MASVQLVVAALILCVGWAYAACQWHRDSTKNPLKLAKNWSDNYDRFAQTLGNVTDEDVPKLLLERVDKQSADILEARRALDSKASTLLGYVGGGASFLALLAGASHAQVRVTPLLLVGAFALACCLGFSLAVLWGKNRVVEYGLDNYCRADFLEDPSNCARLAALACYTGVDQTAGAFGDLLEKGKALKQAQFFFSLGSIVIGLNYILTVD
jgi:hypothetical protein